MAGCPMPGVRKRITHLQGNQGTATLLRKYSGGNTDTQDSILLSKMDIAEAFRWIWLLLQDACVFATELGGDDWGLSQQIIAIYLVLTFGWTGSPGEFGVWAWVVKLLHQAFRPSDARWADDVCFHSQFLVDDMVLIEPDLGRRPFESARLARASAKRILGAAAINEKKDLEEGAVETSKLIWGISYDTVATCRSLPLPKIEKAHHLLNDPAFDYGNKRILKR